MEILEDDFLYLSTDCGGSRELELLGKCLPMLLHIFDLGVCIFLLFAIFVSIHQSLVILILCLVHVIYPP